MLIVATLLAGSSESAPERAVASVLPWVDWLLVLDSGLSAEHLASIQTQAGDKFRHVQFTWPHDFAAARNFALDQAAQLGADWAMTIDTDEEMHFPGYSSPAELQAALNANPDIQTWLVSFRGGSYAKERFIRLPARLRWEGSVHESLLGAGKGEQAVLRGAFFTEQPKSPEQMAAKLNRDRQALEQRVHADRQDARAWFYLAMTLERQDEGHLAIASFLRCAELSRWPEEAAWAHYRAATGMFHYGQFFQALEVCLAGHQRCQIPELSWLAGYCCLRLEQYSQALEWCRQAVVDAGDGMRAVSGQLAHFKFLPAWFDAPHDLMRHIFGKLGMARGAEVAAAAQAATKQARLAAHAKYYPGIPIEDDNKLLPVAEVKPLEQVSIQVLESLDDSET